MPAASWFPTWAAMRAAILCTASLEYPCLVRSSIAFVGTDPGGAACFSSDASSSISHVAAVDGSRVCDKVESRTELTESHFFVLPRAMGPG